MHSTFIAFGVAVFAVSYLVYPSISATFSPLYRQGSQSGDSHAPDEDVPDDYDGIDTQGPYIVYTPDMYGSSVRALFDEMFEISDNYVPIQTYEDAGMPHFKPTKRYDLAFNKVACWQDSGVWIAKLSPIEMQFLGVDRFHESDRALDQADEDEFCSRLRLHGASFWTLPPKWPQKLLWCETIECVQPSKRAASLEVGFPSTGGVCVLNTTDDRQLRGAERVALQNALTMDERCNIIMDLDGAFCQDARNCPEMDHLLAGYE